MEPVKTIVFDNLVDVGDIQTGERIKAEFSEHAVDAERGPGLFPPNLSTEEVGEKARAAALRFNAKFRRE